MSESGQNQLIKKYAWIATAVWTVIVAGLTYYGHEKHKLVIHELAKGEARAAFEKDVVYRQWNAMHGGVYVPITQQTPPNPYLAHIAERDITTTAGKKLTLLNPAYMTRQAHVIAATKNGVLGHITSLKPIRPENEASAWEKTALQSFEQGKQEFWAEETIQGKKYYCYMSPLKTEKPCLKCHAFQGYREGDIRGGISISVPAELYTTMEHALDRTNLVTHGLLWILGLALIWGGRTQLADKADKLADQERQANEAIRQAKEEWERTFDAITDPLMILDTNFKIIKANKSTADRLGITGKDAEGLICYKIVHGSDSPPASCPHAKLLSDGRFHQVEVLESRLGGCFHVTVSPVFREDGSLFGSVHSARDITKLKEAEQLLIKYSDDLEKLLLISREVTLASDLRRLYRIFTFAAKELLGLDFSTLMILSEDNSRLTVEDCIGLPESMIGNFSLVEGQGLSTYVVKHKQAETVLDFSIETRFEVPPIIAEKGITSAIAVPMMIRHDVIGVLIGHTLGKRAFSQKETDIYQHIANQAAVAIRNVIYLQRLRTSEKKIQDITSSLGEGLYAIDDKGYVTFMNPEAERLLGWQQEDIMGRNIHELIHNSGPDGKPILFEDCPIRRVIETGNRFASADEVFRRSDGTLFPVSITSAPLMEDGRVVASITAFRDISERKEIEREKEKLITELQKALTEIKTLQGILPICAYCKKIRDDKGAWMQMELYISKRTDAQFSHGICSECAKKEFPDLFTDAGKQGDAGPSQNPQKLEG